ncbi:MAG: PQQ-binding-like beta-propeller repeat protein [Verrucomicrobiales bacterium]|nr:PQQ-binding-like beta-propeller repeat protein [Verrucomicrobiales bacterium]
MLDSVGCSLVQVNRRGGAADRCRRSVSWLVLLLLGAEWSRGGEWPQWRGPRRDGVLVGESLPLRLPENPKVVFRRSLGEGHAGPVMASQRVVVLDNAGQQETAHCLDFRTGDTLWSAPYGELYSDEFGSGPRCTPLIDDDRLYVQSCKGEFRCLGLADGKTRWRFHFSDYGMAWIPDKNSGGGAASRRGNTGSAVIDGERIFVQVGSTQGASIVAFDKRDGRLLWKSQNDLASYSSLSAGRLAGEPQVVAATCEGLLALATHDGRLLWRQPFKTRANRNVLTPLLLGDDVIFAACSIPLHRQRIVAKDGALKPTGLWTNQSLNINLVTPTLAGNHLYGIGAERSQHYVCVDAFTGQLAWSRTGFGEVTSTVTDGTRLLLLTESGECLLLAADPNRLVELGRFQAVGKTFAHPAYAQGILIARDSREVVAFNLAALR